MDKSALDSLRMNRDAAAAGARRRARPWLVGGGIVGAVLLAVAAWWLLKPQAVTAETVTAREAAAPSGGANAATTVLNASGYVVARRIATVASRITGQIVDVRVEEGLSVEEGEILARLDDTAAQVEFALAESRLETARRGEAEVRVRVDEAARTLARTRELHARGLVSSSDLDGAEANAAALAARLAVAESEIRTATAALAVARRHLDDTVIRAPFAGVVVSKNAQPGETISPMSAGGFTRTGIATIVDMASLEVEVDVNEAFINRVHGGQRAEAVLDAYPDWRIPSSVISIVPTADRQKATVRVRIGFDELDPRILPEMGVQVWFLERRREAESDAPVRGAVWVPAAALRGNHVFVVQDGRAVRRAVQAGQRRGGEVEVTAGLRAGDEVVVRASGELADGVRIRQ